MRNWIRAFKVFERYTNNEYALSAEHDRVFVSLDNKPTLIDALELLEVGWYLYDNEELSLTDILENYVNLYAKEWTKFC